MTLYNSGGGMGLQLLLRTNGGHMKNSLLVSVLLILLLAVPAFAADSEEYTGSDNTPVGAATKIITVTTGTVLSVMEEGAFGKDKAAITVKDESGATKIFFIDATASIVDSAFRTLTLQDIRTGQKVKVDQADAGSGLEKVETVTTVD